jgi:hypothetical protein
MAGEYNANVTEFIPTVTVQHPRLGRVKMNAASYDPATCGPIIEGPTTPPLKPGHADPPNFDPHLGFAPAPMDGSWQG